MPQDECHTSLVREPIEQSVDAQSLSGWYEGALSEECQARREPAPKKSATLSLATRQTERHARGNAIGPAFQAGIGAETGSGAQDLEQSHLGGVVRIGIGSAEKFRETANASRQP
jgi:hypothetical protein